MPFYGMCPQSIMTGKGITATSPMSGCFAHKSYPALPVGVALFASVCMSDLSFFGSGLLPGLGEVAVRYGSYYGFCFRSACFSVGTYAGLKATCYPDSSTFVFQ